MEIKDFTKEVRVRLLERVTSPLYSTFIITWCITNWRFVYVTFVETSETLGKSKIQYITEDLYPEGCHTYLELLIIPLFSTGLIIWVLPLLVNLAYKVTEKYKNKRRVDRLKIIGAAPVDGVLLLDALEEIRNKEKDYVNIVAEKKKIDNKITELQNTMDDLKKAIKTKEIENRRNHNEVVECQEQVTNLEALIKGYRHNLSDIFRGVWIRRSNESEKWEIEYFQIQDNKYLGGKQPNAFGEKFEIDNVIIDKRGGRYTFRKIPLKFGEPLAVREPIMVNLYLDNDGVYKGTEGDLPVKYELFR